MKDICVVATQHSLTPLAHLSENYTMLYLQRNLEGVSSGLDYGVNIAFTASPTQQRNPFVKLEGGRKQNEFDELRNQNGRVGGPE